MSRVFAAVVTLLTAAACQAGEISMSEQYAFWSKPSSTTDSETIFVARDRGELTLPASDASREIGRFVATLPPEIFQRIVTAIKATGASSGPGMVRPGTPLGRVALMKGDDPVIMHTYTGEPRAELAPALAVFREASALIRKHPKQVVRGEAAWIEPVIARGKDLRLSLSVQNVGSDRIDLANPAAPGAGGAALTLVLFRIDSDGDREYLRQEELLERHCRLPDAAGSKSAASLGDRISLAPGQSFELELQKEIRLGPGKYPATLRYTSREPDPAVDEFVAGTISVELPAVQIE